MKSRKKENREKAREVEEKNRKKERTKKNIRERWWMIKEQISCSVAGFSGCRVSG
jgi:hypothetical protein